MNNSTVLNKYVSNSMNKTQTHEQRVRRQSRVKNVIDNLNKDYSVEKRQPVDLVEFGGSSS